MGIRASRFVCSVLTLEGCCIREVRSWWITCVGLQASRSIEQDYEWGGSYNRTTSGEVRRGRTMSGQVRVSIINPESKTNYLCDLKVDKPWSIKVLAKN